MASDNTIFIPFFFPAHRANAQKKRNKYSALVASVANRKNIKMTENNK